MNTKTAETKAQADEIVEVRVVCGTCLVRTPSTAGPVCKGVRVDRDGAPWGGRDGASREVVMFTPADITARFRWNLHYGELERVP